jgi:PAS domain-containing protein
MPPGDGLIFLRMKTQSSIIFEISLRSEQEFYETKLLEYSFLYTMFGVLSVMALYNLFTWVQLRRATFLIYVGFNVTIILQFMIVSGIVTHYVEDHDWIMNQGYLLLANISTLMACLFPIFFLSLRQRHPWLLRIGLLQIAWVVSTAFVSLVSYTIAAKLSVLGALGASFFALAAGLVCSWKRFRPAYFFTLAWLVMIIANCLRMAMLAGSIPASFVVEWGVLIGSVTEVVLLSLAMADKIRLVERHAVARINDLNMDLQHEHSQVMALNSNLERLVEERTREIKSILQHIQIGIIAVGKPGLMVTDTHSDSVRALFGTEHIAQRSIMDLLFHEAQVTDEQKSQIQNALESCLDEDAIAFDMNSHLLPHEITRRAEQGERSLQLDWNPVIDNAGKIEKILLSIKDITALKKLEKEAEEKSQELELIGEILEIPTRQFGIFIKTSLSLLAENLRLLQGKASIERDVLKILFINMHTIKGAARALQLRQLTPFIHVVEQNMVSMLSGEKSCKQDTLLQDTERVQAFLEHYQELNQGKLGRDSEDMISLPVTFMGRLHKALRLVEKEMQPTLRDEVKPLRETIEDLTFIRAEAVFREVLSHAEMLARDLRKECPDIVIQDNAIRLSSKGQEFVRKAFLHVIRNSMDHGIETAKERLKSGKASKGCIEVMIENHQGGLRIRYRDDGRGLNIRAIRRLALERRLVHNLASLSLEDIAQLIFEPGFSTSQEVNEYSGRGVGMSAVKEYVEKFNGTVTLHLCQL